ncbi:pro-apoptotic serine protease NMA111 [Colletotrichum liriopes]|uniref:Pro-apoptotic serine protease NMA111 n=1 Tax=Colletotrichum liriopes TaxID=708192 RepID=A0AA37LYK6_9PEZI|nr:pro-apoptotic serine protease NMA111 [Colletotrichum liriopes]
MVGQGASEYFNNVPIAQEHKTWQNTIDNVIRAVVSIHYSHPYSFDGEDATVGQATGFVVDVMNGYVLTNRHVLGAGPFSGFIVFSDHEAVNAHSAYRDPIHDFAFLRFDPKAVKHMELYALDLRPDLAEVGVDIRMVGNDAGEHLSIASGTISRLDRNAPLYAYGYQDFNTSYIQASTGSSGGSSGSPVVNIEGFAVALQAGRRSDGASTNYFLPLDRPLRALECIRNDKPVIRGDIQCQFLLEPFEECCRLGLSSEEEQEARRAFPKNNTLLVAKVVLAQGQSDQKIMEGDILIKVNDKRVVQFTELSNILDSNVGNVVRFQLQRGGENIKVDIEVGDLHKITPDRFVSVAGASFHSLSYQLARRYGVACQGVFLCNAAGSFIFGDSQDLLIQAVDQKDTPDLVTFIEVMKKIADRSDVVITYKLLWDWSVQKTTTVCIDRHWSPIMEMGVRNDKTGVWDFTILAHPLPSKPPAACSAFIKHEDTNHRPVADLAHSLVNVSCSRPFELDGAIDCTNTGSRYYLARNCAPLHVRCNRHYWGAVAVEAKLVFLHPLQNYAIVQYDAKRVHAPVLSAKLSTEDITQGTSTTFWGHTPWGDSVQCSTTVTGVTALATPENRKAPAYRAVNVEDVLVDTILGHKYGGGVLTANDGTVQALLLSYRGLDYSMRYHGLAAYHLLHVVSQMRQGTPPKLRMLSVQFEPVDMVQAGIMGVSKEWLHRVANASKTHPQLLKVKKRVLEHGQQSYSLLENDILLALIGQVITSYSDLDVMYHHEALDAIIVREGKEIHIKAHTIAAEDVETDRLVFFCGATLQRPHHAVRQQASQLHSNVYVSACQHGSPSNQYGLKPVRFITHVNGKPTSDLEAFLAVVQKIPNDTCQFLWFLC